LAYEILKNKSFRCRKAPAWAITGMSCIKDISIYDTRGRLIEQRKIPEMISGYEYEVLDCMKAMKAGRIESDMMPHSETLKLMELMDTLRAQWGMKLPCE
jgi:hypothetical protein